MDDRLRYDENERIPITSGMMLRSLYGTTLTILCVHKHNRHTIIFYSKMMNTGAVEFDRWTVSNVPEYMFLRAWIADGWTRLA
jgi:hypothetical protein